MPWRGRKATSRSPTSPIVIGALGSPYGVAGQCEIPRFRQNYSTRLDESFTAITVEA
ncbi:Uncharacterised protein [Mycobacteroides abscessus subsp. abscessus]|nr:Uncharacterised protein [Mycobacteroides abscessus subsp. abscessus]